MLTLHYAPRTISIAVAMVLEETGQDYTPVLVDFGTGAQQSPAYLALNPKGRVPLLDVDGTPLTETGALLEFLAPELVPDDPLNAARMREVMYYLAGTMHVAHAHKLRGSRWADETTSHADMTRKVPETMTACCTYLEEKYAFDPYVVGPDLTVADFYLFMVMTWLEGDGVDLVGFPKMTSYFDRMRNRPCVASVREKGML